MTTCTSCGRDDEETVPPEGVAADAASLGALPEPVAVDEVEHWCATCRDQFPHVAADA